MHSLLRDVHGRGTRATQQANPTRLMCSPRRNALGATRHVLHYCSKVAALRIILNIDGCGVHTSLGVYHMSSTIPLPTRDQLCNWSCSNKQQPCPGLIAASAATGKFKAHVTQTCCEPRFDVCHLLLHMTLLFQHFASLASFTLAYATGIFRCKGLQMVE